MCGGRAATPAGAPRAAGGVKRHDGRVRCEGIATVIFSRCITSRSCAPTLTRVERNTQTPGHGSRQPYETGSHGRHDREAHHQGRTFIPGPTGHLLRRDGAAGRLCRATLRRGLALLRGRIIHSDSKATVCASALLMGAAATAQETSTVRGCLRSWRPRRYNYRAPPVSVWILPLSATSQYSRCVILAPTSVSGTSTC